MDAENNEKIIAEDGVKIGKNVKKGIEQMRARIGKESEEKRGGEVVIFLKFPIKV